MKEAIRLIKDKNELKGTCYYEFLPGEYRQKCWNEGSIFLSEEVFSYLLPILCRRYRGFDLYGISKIEEKTWQNIIGDLDDVIIRLKHATSVEDIKDVGPLHLRSKVREFSSEFRANADELAGMFQDLKEWIREQLKRNDCISVLGL